MKKGFIVFGVCFIFLATGVAMTGLDNNLYAGKKAGNSGFANIEDSDSGDVSGWVRYSKRGKCLRTTWVIKGLVPNETYQLKLHSKCGDPQIKVCDEPNTGNIWECGDWGDETFLVIDTVVADDFGHIKYGAKECRLPVGDYQDMMFIVTQNESPWDSAWTWEDSEDTDGEECTNDLESDISKFEIVE